MYTVVSEATEGTEGAAQFSFSLKVCQYLLPGGKVYPVVKAHQHQFNGNVCPSTDLGPCIHSLPLLVDMLYILCFLGEDLNWMEIEIKYVLLNLLKTQNYLDQSANDTVVQ